MKSQRQRKTRYRYTEEIERHIVALIEQWPANRRLKWAGIIGITRHDLGLEWTRQTLEKKPAIRAAYDAHVARYQEFIRTGKSPKPALPEVIASGQKIDQLQATIALLGETLRRSDERLVRYLANAIRFGITQEQLESPVPMIVTGNDGD